MSEINSTGTDVHKEAISIKTLSTVVFTVLLASLPPLFAQVQGQWVAGTMQSARRSHALVALAGGKALAVGGVDNSGNLLASAEVYSSATGTWKLTGRMAKARQAFAAVTLKNGKVLVTGGVGLSNVILASAELYNPTTGSWSAAASMPVARSNHTATLLANGKVLVTGGCGPTHCTSAEGTSEIYDPVSNSWSSTASLNNARVYHTAVLLKNGKVLVVGGLVSGAVSRSCELYDPTKGTWSTAASTNVGRYQNTTTLLADGKVLAAGGTPSRAPLKSAEVYDPIANVWKPTGNMPSGRYAHAAALLGNGTVVVAGGIGSISCGKLCTAYIPTSKVDIFNETAGTFTPANSLNRSLAYHNMTLLSTGRALESGGVAPQSTCCVVTSDAEVYTPLTLTFSPGSLYFGLLPIGLTSPPQTVTVKNVSGHPVSFTSIAAGGDYAETHTCQASLSSGQSCAITVTFTPVAPGTRTGAVTLKDNSLGSPSQTIALKGVGQD